MKIVIAPDSFKESLDAMEVASCIQKGFESVFPNAEYIKLPLADGGEGTVDVLLQGLNGHRCYSEVSGPLGEPVRAMWALLDNGQTALIEIAAASGLDLVPREKRNPTITSTYGTGELIRNALDAGVNKIILGLGGSSTNDGGAGIVQALGGKLIDKNGHEISRGGIALTQLETIDLSEVDPRIVNIELVIACDVNNPLCGQTGASAVFGPQKGATPDQVHALDNALNHFSTVATAQCNAINAQTPGFGAAGGTPMGLSLLCDIKLQPGIEMVLETLNAKHILEGASLLITGEGQMDNQTLNGKTPYGIACLAQQANIPVIGIAGSLGTEIDKLYSNFKAIFGTVRSPQELSQILREAELNLVRVSRNVASTLYLGMKIAL